MSLICKKINVQGTPISLWKVVHQDSFWNRGKSNSEMTYWFKIIFFSFFFEERFDTVGICRAKYEVKTIGTQLFCDIETPLPLRIK